MEINLSKLISVWSVAIHSLILYRSDCPINKYLFLDLPQGIISSKKFKPLQGVGFYLVNMKKNSVSMYKAHDL